METDNGKEYSKELLEKGYKKLSKKAAAKLDACMGFVPMAIMDAEAVEVYKVIYDKSKGTLQRAADKNGYRAAIVGKKGNNDIVGDARLLDPDKGAEAIANAFAVMSVVVGEYYMAEIDRKLDDIDAKLDSIVDFLEAEQKAKIVGWEEFLKKTQKNIFHYESDDVLRTSALTTILSIQKDTLALMEHYRLILVEKIGKLDVKDKADKAQKKVLDILRTMYEYWNATFLYTYSEALEALISKNPSEEFLDNKVEEMMDVCTKYKDNIKKFSEDVNGYIKNLKALDPNKVLEILDLLQYVDSDEHKIIAKFGFLGKAASGFEEKDVQKKKNKRKSLFEVFDLEPVTNIDLMMNKVNDVIRYNVICNKPVEVVKCGNDFYIKTEEQTAVI